MKRILVVLGSSQVGGAEKQCGLFLNNLMQEYDFELIVLGRKGEFASHISNFCENVYFSSGTVWGDVSILISRIKAFQPNVLITWLYRADILGGTIGKILGINKIVGSARNSELPKFSFWKKWLISKNAQINLNLVVCNSINSKIWHQSIGYPIEKLVTVPNYLPILNLDESPKHKKPLVKPIRIGIAARAVNGKGHKILISAAQILESQGYKITISFIGFGIPAWKELLNQQTKVELELLEGKFDLRDWFNSIDIYCSASEKWESDSNSVLEAILHNKPLVVSDLLKYNEISPLPMIFESGNPLELSRAISEVINNIESEYEKASARKSSILSTRNQKILSQEWKRVLSL